MTVIAGCVKPVIFPDESKVIYFAQNRKAVDTDLALSNRRLEIGTFLIELMLQANDMHVN